MQSNIDSFSKGLTNKYPQNLLDEVWFNALCELLNKETRMSLEQIQTAQNIAGNLGIYEDALFFKIEELIKLEKIESEFVKSFLNNRKISPWALASGTLEFLDNTLTSESKILEFGAGISTEFLAQKLYSINNNDLTYPRIISFEQNEEYAYETNSILKKLKLDNIAKVFYTPIINAKFNEFYFQTYDIRNYIAIISQFNPNFFLIDGPSGGGLNRLGSIIIAMKFASPNSNWILDDALRDNEIRILNICEQLGFIKNANVLFKGKGIGNGDFNLGVNVISDINNLFSLLKNYANDKTDEKLTWDKIKNKRKNFYAGDIPDRNEYQNLIGLSITKNDSRHIQHDITLPFPLEDNSVESFQAEDVFEHIPYEKLPKIIDEIYRVLKPGATFRLSIPDYGCDVLIERSVKDENGKIIFDPVGGGTIENPGHLWFPNISNVKTLLNITLFAKSGKINFLHHYNPNGTFVLKNIDYSKGFVMRNPDHDERVRNPKRPLSLIVDLIKKNTNNNKQESEVFYASTFRNEFKYSIVLTVYQKESQIEKILETLINNTTSAFELIIVFDGCTDRSEMLTRNYLENNKGKTEKILFIKTPDVNETKANNAGLRVASGIYTILLQDDMNILEIGWEKRIIYPLEVYDDTFAVGARNAHSFSFSEDNSVGYTDTTTAQREKFIIRDAINRGPIAFKTEIVAKLNFFDEEYSPLYFDEMDLCIRAFLKYRKRCGVYAISWENLQSTVGSNSEKILSSGEKYSEVIERNRKVFWDRYHDIYKNLNHDEDRTLVFNISDNDLINSNASKEKNDLGSGNKISNTHKSFIQKYYSQGGEDNIISKIFSEKKEGIYIDVGAHHPIDLSNTYHFYNRGWRGICIEPNLDLIHNYKVVRPRDVVLNIAAGNFNGNAEIFFGEYTVHSSLKKSNVTDKGKKEVKVVRLEDILDSAGFPKEFEFISVDTEGTEIDVLKGLNLDKYRPRIIVAEYNTAGKIDSEIEKYLVNKGYNIIYINKWNLIFSNNFENDIRLINN